MRMIHLDVQRGFTLANSLLLSLLTASYIVGEIAHFQIGSISREMARDIEFGRMMCFEMENIDSNATLACTDIEDEFQCGNATDPLTDSNYCVWDYSGQGIQYQILAGPIFVVVYSTCSIITGFFADKFDRSKLLCACIMLFSICGCLMAVATEYWHLVVTKMGIAAGEAALRPVATALIAELFHPASRGVANGIFSWGIYIGYGLTFVLGNYAAPADILGFGWRPVFIIGCIWGIPLSLATLFFKDPRQTVEKSGSITSLKSSETSESVVSVDSMNNGNYWKSVLRSMIQLPMVLLLLAASVRHLAGFSWSLNTQLYMDEYYDYFNPGLWVAMDSIVGGSFGVFFGGWFSDRAAKRLGLHSRLWILAACLAVATPFAVGVLTMPPPQMFYMLMAYYFFSETWFAILFTVMSEIVPAEVRSVVVGIFLFIMDNLGGNLSILVDPVAQLYGYRTALIIFFPSMVAASAVLFFLASLPLYRQFKKEKKIVSE